ncbi:hypothetical protein MHF_1106 [Mycoplasma haemofelis Ohio2]|uniref:Uncharacterized protein n=1 Tax=Mycoplasma haemofelis (strain Ohio2) TaxID=859194 RepID=F6FJJ8_MYCHI|nr:hypothetical protein MHF_1106 [Mycoplasma haemofelis Ohio2]
MSISIPKVAALGSALVGTGAIFSEAVGSGSSESPLPQKIQDSPISKTSSSKAVTPLQGACRIWEVRIENTSYNVREIVREIKNRDELVDESGSSNEKFRSEIRDACLGKKSGHAKIGSDIYIYVFKSDGKWMYSSYVQGHDWHIKKGIADPYRSNK